MSAHHAERDGYQNECAHRASLLRRKFLTTLAVLATIAAVSPTARAEDKLADLEQEALAAAVQRVAPSVVQVQTVGGLGEIERRSVGTGPTTGLIVSSDGYIVSSAYNFIHEPASILIAFAGGQRLPAQLVATDHSRMIVLLKVSSDRPLPVSEAATEREMQVGAWAVAVGRGFETQQTNISVGIISALGRIMGKVIQTDAGVSPSNYGGPLVDIHGRVLGLLVPMSPQNEGELAGVEWYNSGIGFAVPLQHIENMLPAMKMGNDLHPGILGVSLKAGDPFSAPSTIAVVKPNSPAQRAGLESGDLIVAVDGHEVHSKTQLRYKIGGRYSGETVRLALNRDGERLERDVELVDKLPPFEHAFLGILPKRLADDAQQSGVPVRFVYPDSPAESAGIRAGDRIESIDGHDVAKLADALEATDRLTPDQQLVVQLRRGEQAMEVELVAGQLPSAIAGPLPPARDEFESADGDRPQVGQIELEVPGTETRSLLYVPETYHPNVAYGLVVWLHAAGGDNADDLVARWKPLCDQHDLILLAPRSTDHSRWDRAQAREILSVVGVVSDTYQVDPLRVVAHGHQAGGAMAYLIALQDRRTFSGLAVVDAPLPRNMSIPPNEPVHRLAIYVAHASGARFASRIRTTISDFQSERYPVTVIDLAQQPRALNLDELAALARWIDTLDRF